MKRFFSVRNGGLSRTLLFGSLAALAACGAQEPKSRSRTQGAGAAPNAGNSDATAATTATADDATPRLAQDPNDQVISTLVVNFGKDGMALTNSAGDQIHWVVDMQESEEVKGGVAPQKYLRVKGDLSVPSSAENKEYDVGCLFVEMKDNVYYREKTWLRMATTAGIKGIAYPDVKLPMSVDLGGWQPVPQLDDSLTLQTFSGNTLKKFDGTLCFKLDFSNAPADQYQGQLVVQYLRPGDVANPPSCDKTPNLAACAPKPPVTNPDPVTPPPTPFSCASIPSVLKAKQTTELHWNGAGTSGLEIKLAADNTNYKGSLGSFIMKDKATAIYQAPSTIPANVRIIATARAMQTEALPAFCEVNLVADDQLGCHDDGEIQGVTGNVYQLPANTAKLPDLDKMTPVDNIVTPNLDVPDRDFMAGFPGVKNLVEWFAIKFRSQLIIAESKACTFKVASDDGAIVYLDDAKIIDNDGNHPVQSKESTELNLTKGNHALRVDWYQGPRVRIALQLFWKCGNDTSYSMIPPSAFVRPLQ